MLLVLMSSVEASPWQLQMFISFPHARGRRGVHCPQAAVTKVPRSRGAGLRLFTEIPQSQLGSAAAAALGAPVIRIQGCAGHPEKGGRTV